ncbi:MAG: hypothetical protein WA418_30010 [Bradyrhizobium sp.]
MNPLAVRDGKNKAMSTLVIDRVSGEFEQTVQSGDQPATVHAGKCIAAKKAL